jgi:hypothetical protein
MKTSIELHIEQLVLHGFASADRHRIARAVENEIARLITVQGVPTSLEREGSAGSIKGGQITVAPGAGPSDVGKQVAQAVLSGLRQMKVQ